MNFFTEKFEKNIYRLIGCFVLACIAVFSLGSLQHLNQTNFMFALFVLIPVVFISGYAFLVEKYPKIVLTVTPVLLCILCSIIGWEKVFVFFDDYTKWIKGIYVEQTIQIFLFQATHLFLIVSISYIIEVLLERFFVLKMILGFLFIVYLSYSMFSKTKIPYLAVVFVLVFLAVLLIQWTQRNWKKIRKQSNVRYMIGMMVFVLIFFVFMIFMPISEEPYQWKYVKASVAYCKEKVVMLMNDLFQEEDTFTFTLAGFSREGAISGNVEEEQREIMTVTANHALQTNLYLAGKYFNEFDNVEWVAKQKEKNSDVYIDTLQTVYALRNSEIDNLNSHYKKIHLKIEYKDLNTSYLFAPEKTYAISDSKENNLSFKTDDGSLFFRDSQNYGSVYYTDFYQMDLLSDELEDLLTTPVKEDDKLWKDMIKNHKQAAGMDIKADDFESFEQTCYQEYAMPVVLSDEVEAYLDSVTLGAKDELDILRAIEKELHSYSYSVHPGEMPQKVNDATSFLDYFLLEKKDGYCSHFATTFVLLARAQGLPARYVQGFCVPMYGKREAVVMSDMAHAWPEVYIKDIGWIAFEPTPGYGEMRYTTWKIGGTQYTGSNYYSELYQRKEEFQNEGVQEEEAEDLTEVTVQVASVMAKIVVVLLIFAVVLPIVIILIRKLQYRRLSVEDKYLLMIKKNFRLLRAFGLELSETETITEYAGRIKIIEGEAVSYDFLNEYEQVIYGNRIVDDKMLGKAEEQYKKTLLYLKEKSDLMYLKYCVMAFIKYGV